MKKIFSVLALLVLLVVPAQAFASYYYTLEGSAGAINDGGGLASISGISVGNTGSYLVEIDADQTGPYTKGNGKNQSYLEILNLSSDFSDLTVGSTVNLTYESAFNTNWSAPQIAVTNLKADEASNVVPIPIPGAAFILLGGLGVVGFVKRIFI
ncbi:hypothetical protein [Maridesulfovibrio sp.]|uniref:hypothetical protein n=1 Tax=Maridesulfovibrio sp. TaxID=2795000 RepID=UPI0029CA9E95|nr:hypothetical protein [Maridesulfovibrio sp.]